MIDAVPIAIVYLDPQERYLFSNHHYEVHYRRNTGEIFGRTMREVLGPERYKEFEPYIRRVLVGETVQFETAIPITGEINVLTFIPDIDDRGELRGFAGLAQDITEYRNAIERLNLTMRAAQMGAWHWSIKTGQVQWDERTEALFGFEPGSFPGTYAAFFAAVHPDDRVPTLKRSLECQSEKRDFSMEYRTIWPDGSIHWLQSIGRVFYDSNGELDSMHGMAFEITERKRNEEALRFSEARFESFANLVPQIISVHETNGSEPPFYSQSWFDYSGLSPSNNTDEERHKLIHPDDLQSILADWDQARVQGLPYEGEMRIRRQDGVFRWFLVKSVPLKDSTGKVAKWFALFTDIHSSKASELQALALQNLSASLLRADTRSEVVNAIVSEGRRAIGADALVINWKNTKEQTLESIGSVGYRQALVDKFAKISIDADLPAAACVRESKIKLYPNRGSWTFPEITDQFAARASIPLMRDKEAVGSVTFAFCEPQEFDRSFQAVMQLLADEFSQSVLRAELLEQAKEEKRKANLANEAKSLFLANMSHEIRTPLNAILGFSKLIKEPGLTTAERQDYIRRVEVNGDHLLRIVDDILDLSRIEARQMKLDIEALDIRNLMTDAFDSLRVLLHGKSIEPKIEFAKSLPALFASDRVRVKQALMNLIANAVKFTEAGHIRIALSFNQTKKTIAIEVEDTGIGIAAEVQDQLFRPFAQGDRSITRKHGGTGLGLVISRSICEALGGSLDLVESHSGHGTVFRMELPDLSDRIGVTAKIPRRVQSASGILSSLSGKKILIAEDSIDNRVLIREYLKDQHMDLSFVENGLEALNQAKAADFDLILMDLQMPVLDGLEATRRIRSVGYDGPILAFTAHALQEEVERSLQAGCNSHLTKPISKEALISTLESFLH